MTQQNGLRNLIFDYGGVILNIDFFRTVIALSELGMGKAEDLLEMYNSSRLFDNFEKGLISPADFRSEMKKLLARPVTDIQLDEAWNALLLDMPPARITLLQSLKKRYRTFLLSNSNRIHYDFYVRELQRHHGIPSFDELFEKAYFSFDIQLRKPSPEIFSFVAKAQGIHPEETLFIDDSQENIQAAAGLGFQCLHVRKGEDITLLLAHL
jgi:putative hydrolase of the HAD superfamily